MKYLLLIVLIFSCNIEKKFQKLNYKHSDIVAKECSLFYPCIITETKIDSTLLYQWKKKIDSLSLDFNNRIDTLIIIKDTFPSSSNCSVLIDINKRLSSRLNASNEFINTLQKELRNIPVVYKTNTITDTAKLITLYNQIKSSDKVINDFKKSEKNYLLIIIFLLIALFFSIIINIIKLK